MTTPTAQAQLDKLKENSDKAKAQEQEFEKYVSARPSVRLITDGGFRITFTDYQYITQNEDAIAYLDKQIKLGLPGITKEGTVTSTDLNPMAKLRKEVEDKVRKDLEEQILAEARGESKDMGSTEKKADMKVASTKTVPAAKS